jgi:hypothetical protein
MATLENLRAEIQTSLHGRALGLDKDSFLISRGIRLGITSATSDTTGTALPNYGLVSVTTTTNDSWTLTDPVEGCEVHLFTGSTSTGTHTIVCAAATVLSSVSSTGPGVVLTGGAAAIVLVGISTAIWKVSSRTGTTATSYVSSA